MARGPTLRSSFGPPREKVWAPCPEVSLNMMLKSYSLTSDLSGQGQELKAQSNIQRNDRPHVYVIKISLFYRRYSENKSALEHLKLSTSDLHYYPGSTSCRLSHLLWALTTGTIKEIHVVWFTHMLASLLWIISRVSWSDASPGDSETLIIYFGQRAVCPPYRMCSDCVSDFILK